MTQLSLATWNVLADCYLTPDLYPNTPVGLLLPGARTAAIVTELLSMVERLRLDAVCVQEAHGSLLAELETVALPRGWRVLRTTESETARDQCVVLLCGKWRLGSHDRRSYKQAPDNHAQRLALLRGTTTVILYNTHLQWALDNGRLTGAQGAELASWASREAQPTIVAGDLNSPRESPAVQQLIGIGFTDLHPLESLRTAEFLHTGPLRLDYILVRGARGRSLPATDLVIDGREPLPGWRCPSDHLPLAACVSVGRQTHPVARRMQPRNNPRVQ